MTNSPTRQTTTSSTIRLADSTAMTPPLGHYSHVAVHNGIAHISGQLPVDTDGTPAADEPFDTQVRMVLCNLDYCLAAAGTDRDHLISVTVYVTDIAQWPEFDAIYAEWLGSYRPARAVAGVSSLHYGAAVEVQAVAAVNTGSEE
ncbi:RidA family protein [Streptomyces nojiriensis]|uniref:RidA family protein n=1 Tax=Streptomyces nojiriensis TaxID=66374 RepID=UPI002E17ABB4